MASRHKNFNNLLCVIDNFIKYAWFTPSSVKKNKAVLNAFIEIVNESNLKSSKLWVDKGREFYNQLMQEYLDNNVTLMYSA